MARVCEVCGKGPGTGQERLAHRSCNTGKGSTKPVVEWPDDLLIADPAVHASLAGVSLRNRIIRSGCFEGMSQGGVVTERLIEHHRRVAAGGVAMTTLSYCSVSSDGRAFGHELWMAPENLGGLSDFTRAVHGEGA